MASRVYTKFTRDSSNILRTTLLLTLNNPRSDIVFDTPFSRLVGESFVHIALFTSSLCQSLGTVYGRLSTHGEDKSLHARRWLASTTMIVEYQIEMRVGMEESYPTPLSPSSSGNGVESTEKDVCNANPNPAVFFAPPPPTWHAYPSTVSPPELALVVLHARRHAGFLAIDGFLLLAQTPTHPRSEETRLPFWELASLLRLNMIDVIAGVAVGLSGSSSLSDEHMESYSVLDHSLFITRIQTLSIS
ncbi:uncharacterized protein EV420DRAFT_1691085 [Desarmillaria tabescens]|uniref:Uncharacterized protein n=1 Tax=Armillaria tabescens TaxID=1929756 RepID=A0AA39N4E5_ARMTA|nr:uncharacterized protein EV420DRAFT_1691085 [Desarmillaria tabescens]KAK0457009.1 hypothetical protein EV420DRAFT_1691085 [Desarmillaria tabescens]